MELNMATEWGTPLGDKRVKEKLFLFPKKLNGVRKWGRQKVEQVLDLDDYNSMLEQKAIYFWRDVKWID